MLKERELAQRWCVSQRTLQRWRKEGYGPPWLTIGGNIRYRLSDIEHFETIHSSEDQS
jgi:predicted site-specific integrase-resolvase